MIDNHEKNKNRLTIIINELSEELKNKEIIKKENEDELYKIKKEYIDKVPIKYRTINEIENKGDLNGLTNNKNNDNKNCIIFWRIKILFSFIKVYI